MKRVLGALYLSVIMFGAYALTTNAATPQTPAKTADCGSCRAKNATTARQAPVKNKQRRKAIK